MRSVLLLGTVWTVWSGRSFVFEGAIPPQALTSASPNPQRMAPMHQHVNEFLGPVKGMGKFFCESS